MAARSPWIRPALGSLCWPSALRAWPQSASWIGDETGPTNARLKQLKAHFQLSDDFDLHDPENLAPICGRCNRAKGATDDDAPYVKLSPNRAAKRRDAVIARVQSFGSPGKLSEHLLNVQEADLSDQVIRDEFQQHAPALVQILSTMGTIRPPSKRGSGRPGQQVTQPFSVQGRERPS